MTKKDGATDRVQDRSMCAMPSSTQMAALAYGSTRATHPGFASWSKLHQGGESEGGRGGSGVSRLYLVGT